MNIYHLDDIPDDLKSYFKPIPQLGLERTPEEYVAAMVGVFREVRRVLADDGTLFLNLGDSYFGGGRGGGGSFASERPGWREVPCDTSGTGPEDSPSRDCFCRSLCGACREAYRIGRSHSGYSPASTRSSSSSASIPEHTGLPSGRPPTSGFVRRGDHIEASIPDQQPSPRLESGPPRASRASISAESFPPRRDGSSPASIQAEGCRLCGRSLLGSAPASARMEACICDTAGGASVGRMTGTDASGLAYPDFTTVPLKPKDLVGIPWRVAFALQADGWYLRSDIIWHKPNPMPESVTDRPTKAHEYVFLLSKQPRYFYDAGAIAEPVIRLWDASNGGNLGSGTHKRNGAMREAEREYPLPNESGTRNARTVWTIPTQPTPDAHFATFPEALAERCILAGSAQGDVILDPFFGSGTVGKVAERLGRKWVGIELNPAYVGISERKTAQRGIFV